MKQPDIPDADASRDLAPPALGQQRAPESGSTTARAAKGNALLIAVLGVIAALISVAAALIPIWVDDGPSAAASPTVSASAAPTATPTPTATRGSNRASMAPHIAQPAARDRPTGTSTSAASPTSARTSGTTPPAPARTVARVKSKPESYKSYVGSAGCLTDSASGDPGLAGCDPSSELQRWQVTVYTDGTLQLRNVGTSQCLTADIAKWRARSRSCDGSAAQVWDTVPRTDDGAFGIVGSGSCLGVNSGPYLVLTKSCTANGAQTWT